MIHLIVGNTGAGKTTYAQKLKLETKGILFSIDFWNKTLFLQDVPESDSLNWILERIDRSETVICALILQLSETNVDAILDLGLSKFEHRQKFRDFAEKNSLDIKLHYLDVSKSIRKERVVKRNTEKGETFEFEVSDADFEFMETWFEPPAEHELAGGIIVKA